MAVRAQDGRRRRRVIQVQYRIVWKRKGATIIHRRTFAHKRTCYIYLQRLISDDSWMFAGKSGRKRIWANLALVTDMPMDVILKMSTKDAYRALSAHYNKIEWLRVELRQVGEWTRMVEPLDFLKLDDAKIEKIRQRAEAHCAELDAHPEQRYVPDNPADNRAMSFTQRRKRLVQNASS